MIPYNQFIHITSRLLILAVFSFGVTSNTLAVSQPLEETGSMVNSSIQEQKMSTPALIEQAFLKGEITAEQRILYLAYALYDYESLPVQFHGNVGWSGTRYVLEVNPILNAVNIGKNPASSPVVKAEFSDLAAQASTVCGEEDGANSTESSNFYLTYDTVGGGLTIEEYKTSLETTFSTEVTNYGWGKPPFCTSGIGTCVATNPWNKYPVQVSTLESYLYGYVTFDSGSYTGLVGDNPNTPVTETTAYATCMVLNRDFSTFGRPSQESLDVTTAHEFNHAIQFGMVSGLEEDFMWIESGATYIEDDVFDPINDNYQYLWPQFASCLSSVTSVL